MAEPLMELSTLVPEHKVIAIDGEHYELAEPDDLSLTQRRELNVTYRRLRQIEDMENISVTHEEEYSNLTRKLVRIILPTLPQDVLRKVPRNAQEAILITFFGSPSDPRMLAMLSMMNQAGLLIGEDASPDSNDSTEEIPSDGSISQSD